MTETVNSQITDAVTQANVKALGEAPAMSMGNLYQAISHSIAMAAANAVNAQQQANVTYQSATTQAIIELLNADTNTATREPVKAPTTGGTNDNK